MTTILCVKKGNNVAIGGDGQISLGSTIVKNNASKIRWLYKNKIVAGFAGNLSDAFTLFEKFEGKLEQYSGNLKYASVELAKDWRMDNFLRKLESLLIVANKKELFIISGNGDIIQPEHNAVSIGSGGNFAQSAAIALINNTNLTAKEIVKKSLLIAASICIYTNSNLVIKELGKSD